MTQLTKQEIKGMMVQKSAQMGGFAKSAGWQIDSQGKTNSSNGRYVIAFTNNQFTFFWRLTELNAFLNAYNN
jgi:hypothetical protein